MKKLEMMVSRDEDGFKARREQKEETWKQEREKEMNSKLRLNTAM